MISGFGQLDVNREDRASPKRGEIKDCKSLKIGKRSYKLRLEGIIRMHSFTVIRHTSIVIVATMMDTLRMTLKTF